MSGHHAIIVTDLGFGDAGKGTITDALVRQEGARLVVRYNGGAQAAHAVVTTDGRSHVFHQFGSGTFVPEVATYLSRFMLVNPLALFWEEQELQAVGVSDAFARLSVAPDALLTTPYHVAANRLREWARGEGRHGSCGLGIGETMADALEHEQSDSREAIPRVGDLAHPARLREKLLWHRALKREQLEGVLASCRKQEDLPPSIAQAVAELSEDDELEAALEVYAHVASRLRIVSNSFLAEHLAQPGATVFEGAQGVLLDEWRGFHPYTTWSTTTTANARRLLEEAGFEGQTTTLGLLRAYATRHGPGPFVTEDAELSRLLPDVHNGMNPWQRAFRVGWLDLVVLRYALAVAGKVDCLAVTCLDRVASLWPLPVCRGYRYEGSRAELAAYFAEDTNGVLTDIRPGPEQDLEYQETITELLDACRPERFHECADAGALVETVARELGRPVAITAYGPTAADKRFLSEWQTRTGG